MILQKFLLLVIGGSVLSSVVIAAVFLFINICLRKKAAKYNARTKSRTNLYTNGQKEKDIELFKVLNEDATPPPLPSREQFDTPSVHSYEDVNLVDHVTTVPQEETSPHFLTKQPTTQLDLQDHQNFSHRFVEEEQMEQSVYPSNYEVSSIPDYLDLEQNEHVDAKSELDYDDVDAQVDAVSLEYEDAVPVDAVSLDYDDVGAADADADGQDYDEVG